MLIILIHNDGTGTDEAANYTYEVRINERSIAGGVIKGYNRADGWATLARDIAQRHVLTLGRQIEAPGFEKE